MIKSFKIIILSVFLCVFCSCTKEVKHSLEVFSADYIGLKELEEEEFDFQNVYKWIMADYEYGDYSCYVTVNDVGLVVSKNIPENECRIMPMNNGYFVGIDLGEFDGWIRYYPYHSNYPESEDSILMLEENIFDFIKADNDNGFIITYVGGNSSLEDICKIYGVKCNNDSFICKEMCSLNGLPKAALLEDEQEIIIITSSGIYLYSIENNNYTCLIESKIIKYVGVNSVVKYNDAYYCGTKGGIYEYNPQTNEEKWFPLNYAKWNC